MDLEYTERNAKPELKEYDSEADRSSDFSGSRSKETSNKSLEEENSRYNLSEKRATLLN
jgi:hypothetical protein